MLRAKEKFVKNTKLKILYWKSNVVHNVRANFYSLLESLTLGMFWKLRWPDARYMVHLYEV